MTNDEINKAFEGRWNYKCRNFEDYEVRQLSGNDVKELCRDFFEAGIIIAGRNTSPLCCNTIATEYPSTDEEAFNVTFDNFWNIYDKKVGRPKCETLWAKLTLRDKYDCLNYIPLYKQAQPDKQYRKNPETFLRNKSWNDEIIPHDNGTYKPTIEQQRREKLADILTD